MKSSCYCLLLFVLVSAASIWGMSAHPLHQLGGNTAVTKINDVSTVRGQDIDEMVSPSTSTATKEDTKIGGRKMGALHKVVRLEKEFKVEVDAVSGRKSNSKTASSSSSELEGKSPRRSHEANTIGNGESRQSSSVKGGVDHDHNDEYSAGFVAFSQDYHSPRHHPPKNN
ncbi:unnamed protein product [Prunus armeniaca]|uniref:Uncharacterized protein n=1 Tax=Prunus armeniaca TaxID=36596 RepID=A0A6J5W6H8_PRUAR|nr:unnamed protein product [Prunus armeniaca]